MRVVVVVGVAATGPVNTTAVMVRMVVRMMQRMVMGVVRVESRHAGHTGHARHFVEEISLAFGTLFGVEERFGKRIVLDLQGGDLEGKGRRKEEEEGVEEEIKIGGGRKDEKVSRGR